MLIWKVLLILFSSILIFVENGLSPTTAGKYFEVNLDRFDVLEENKNIWEWNVKVKKINKTRSLVGYSLFNAPVGDDFKVEGKVLKKQGGEYRLLPYNMQPAPFCSTLAKDEYMYPEVAKNSDFPEDVMTNCPFKPNNYSFYGVSISMKNVPKIIAPSGDYAIEAIIYDPESSIAAKYRLYVTIIQV
ncbi:hypothetical protein PVAND_008587 [Polypedilum vanderplanki]|uniref:Uncharacterized protein n=1 Tax=Polypedilum vanderplanki TaxID=319348 RepID=A0A9J6CA12_POLVA|nr:hypothetical protein PVAND_008587 [Polypedilum vanderplanki]